MSAPRVSVITIFFNAEEFLDEAIGSVIGQTYESWELLLVDDGSTDGSRQIAERYADKHPERIRCLQHPGRVNLGMSAARNRGLREARGEYIAFLDADDVWLPEKLERQVAILDAQPEAAMVVGPTQWWYSWSGLPGPPHDFVHDPGVEVDRLIPPPEFLVRFLLAEGISPCTCSVLLRREAVDTVGGFEERFRGMYEDQAFFARICARFPVFSSGECLARYRQHVGSGCAVAQRRGEHVTARAAFLTWLSDFLRKTGIRDPRLLETLERELRRSRRTPWPATSARALARRGMSRLRRMAGRSWSVWMRLPVVRRLRCMQFRRLRPLGDGRQVGTPIVRHYWATFLEEHRSDLRGRALEVGTAATIRRYGGAAIERAEAIDLTAHSPEVTVVADLSRAHDVPSDGYDCFVNQFTMHVIHDVEAALYHSIRILKPGGVLLVNFPCVEYCFPRGLDMGTGAPLFVHWCFTPIQVENLLRRVGLEERDYHVRLYGNLFARIAYQLNVPAEELTAGELAHSDPGHPLLICARAVKPHGWQARRPEYRTAWTPPFTPARWTPERGHYA